MKGPKPDLRSRALRCLARREYSRAELERKLAPHAESKESLKAALDEMETRGWLSQRRVVEQVVHARQGKYGANRIALELREKGVPEELIIEAMTLLKAGEFETTRAVWQKKFGKQPQDSRELAKQVRFMQNRGFSLDVIRKVLRQDENS